MGVCFLRPTLRQIMSTSLPQVDAVWTTSASGAIPTAGHGHVSAGNNASAGDTAAAGQTASAAGRIAAARSTGATGSTGNDWWAGTRNVELWWTLAWYDVVLRYRRSTLGPLWLTISTGALLVGMGPLYSGLFKVPINKFFPHLTLGIIFWGFFTSTINDGCVVFINGAQYLKQPGFAPSVLVWRSLARNCLQLAHTIVLYLPVAIWANIPLTPRLLLFVPGFAIVLVNLHALTIILGVLCARFRDVVQIVASMLQLLMFLTPVFWFPSSLSGRSHAILYNPLAQLLDVIRLPLMGDTPAPGTLRFLVLFTTLNIALAAVVYRLYRRHLAYWV